MSLNIGISYVLARYYRKFCTINCLESFNYLIVSTIIKFLVRQITVDKTHNTKAAFKLTMFVIAIIIVLIYALFHKSVSLGSFHRASISTDHTILPHTSNSRNIRTPRALHFVILYKKIGSFNATWHT